VKLGKNASENCAQVSEDYWREAIKKSSIFKWHKQFKVGRSWKMMKEAVIHNVTLPKKVLKKCGIWCI
jgi:hypothetical protein